MSSIDDLLIMGTGVHAREMTEIVQRINAGRLRWRLRGFVPLPASKITPGSTLCGYPVLDLASALQIYPLCHLAFDHEYKRPVDVPRQRWTSLIDPSTFVSTTAQIGAGCVVYPHGYIGLNARLGDRVFALSGTVINHDDVLEDSVTLCSGVTLAGGVHVEAGCYLGQDCTVRQHVRIGRGSLIGMGSVVLHDVPPNSVMVGNPARLLRQRQSQ